MLYSQGVPLEDLGIPRLDGGPVERDPRRIWRLFAGHWHLFRGTPTRMWMEYVLHELFEVQVKLSAESADHIYDWIADCLTRPDFARVHSLIGSTSRCSQQLIAARLACASSETPRLGMEGRIIPTFRPDPVVDPELPEFESNVLRLGRITGENTASWQGYLRALFERRRFFTELGATATDHGHPSAATFDLPRTRCESLLNKALLRRITPEESEQFRGQMLIEMARMSIEDGLVMQIHPGSFRNHNAAVFHAFGRDKGADIPTRIDYVHAMKPLFDRFGNDGRLSIILFTLDESTYSRELAPMADIIPY